MKKTLLRMICFMLTLVLCVSLSAHANATEINPRYEYASRVDANISITPIAGVATCSTIVVAYDDSYTIRAYCYLQYYVNNQWVTLQHWTTNTKEYASITGYYAIERGYQYRVLSVGYLYDASGQYVESCSATKQCSY